MFELVNEPHDLDVSLWAGTVQAAIDAIWGAGATSQTILIPGTEYTHLDAWTDGSDGALLNVTDPNNNNQLVGHIYLDSDGSGTSTECTTTGTDAIDAWASFLEQNGRKGIITETGGGNTDSCVTDLSAALDDVVSSSETITGFVIWAAGSFDTSYALSVTPNSDGTDQMIWSDAVEQYLPGASGNVTATSSVVSATSVATSSLAPSSVLTTNSAATSSIASSAASVGENTEILSSATSAPAPSLAPSSAGPSIGFTSSATLPASVSASASPSPSSALASSIASISTVSTVSSVSFTPSATSSASSGTSGTNLQTYIGALGGIVAPAVYGECPYLLHLLTPAQVGFLRVVSSKGSVHADLSIPRVVASGNVYLSSNQTYNFAIDALDASCYTQMNDCQAAANAGGNQGSLTVSACEGQQVQECLAVASATASS
ncbi:hypothetical protein EHS25_005305 [Saitozyma podzolica]|uniref:cellulase n=1 Tax=Saitozyma podzolica TaxID=1890683 RepID=A0A427XYZ8_9TREE|nr:hypothetical protein EHS25_005305 [Saitozyma podzolica]